MIGPGSRRFVPIHSDPPSPFGPAAVSPALLCLGALLPVATGPAPSFRAAEAAVLHARRQIRSGDVRFERLPPTGGAGKTGARVARVVFEGPTSRSAFGPAGGGWAEQIVADPFRDLYISYVGPAALREGERPVAAAAARLSTEQAPRRFEARLFGLVPEPFGGLTDMELDVFVGRTPRGDARIERVPGPGGEPLLKLSCAWTGHGGRATYTVDPARGWSVVDGELLAAFRGKPLLWAFAAEPGRFGGVWYPRSVTFTETIAGVRGKSETVRVTRATFNEPTPDGAFTPAAVEAPAGTELIVTGGAPVPPGEWGGRGFRPFDPDAEFP